VFVRRARYPVITLARSLFELLPRRWRRHMISIQLLAAIAALAQVPESPLTNPDSVAPTPVAPASQPSPTPSPPSPNPKLSLVCVGQGEQARRDVTTASIYSSQGSASGYATSTHDRAYQDTVSVELDENGGGRLRPPETFIPPAHGGGMDGWWTIQNLVVTGDEISGRISFNIFNSPAVHINRSSGMISIFGMKTSFTGQCEKVDPSVRKF
jgi:hypothetical protein